MRAIYSKTMNGIIGVNGDLIIKSNADMKYFKEITTGNIVIMGRKTYDSLQVKPLPDRINIVITTDTTRDENNDADGKVYYINPDDYDTLFKVLSMYPDKMTYAIGGTQTWTYLDNLGLITSKDVNTFVANIMCCPRNITRIDFVKSAVFVDNTIHSPANNTYAKFIDSVVMEPTFPNLNKQVLITSFNEELESEELAINNKGFVLIRNTPDHKNHIYHQIASILNNNAFDNGSDIIKMANSNNINEACDALKDHLQKYADVFLVLQTGSKKSGDLTSIKKIRFNEFLREIRQNIHDILYFGYIPTLYHGVNKFSEDDKKQLMYECDKFVKSQFIYD